MQAEEWARHEQTPALAAHQARQGEFIFLAPGHPLNLPPAPDLTEESNPYRGLKSYDQQHAALFFGREDEIGELVQRVARQPFLAVLGASGTGKSSLVKAGVLPRLQVEGGRLQAASRDAQSPYHVLSPMRPTDRPVRALEALLHAELGEEVPKLSDATGLSAVIARWAAAHPGRRLVLTIDQFEELATLCRDDDERAHFLHLLAEAVQAQPDAFRLVITLRTDFEPQFTQRDSPLAGVWQAGRYVVPPMDIEDLRQVIEGPASVRVLYFDPLELVDDLIKEVIQTPGALPPSPSPSASCTSSTCRVAAMTGRSPAWITGRWWAVGSLRNCFTEEYDGLPDDAHRITMQRVMLRMVAVEGGELARRRVALSELEYPTAEENARVQAVLDRLVAARLLVRGTADPAISLRSAQGAGAEPGEAYVEPAHDALVLAWDKLLRWKQEAEEYLPLQRRLAQAVSEWRQAAPGAQTGLLWDDDPRLPQVEETLWPAGGKGKGLAGRARWARQVLWPKTDAPADTKWLNGAELGFAQASVSRRGSTLRRIIGITAAVMVALTGLAIFASYQANQATLQRNEASAQRDNAVSAGATAVAEGNARATEVVVRQTAEANAVSESNARATEVIVRTTAEANAQRAAQAEATAAADARQKQAEAESEARRARAGELSVYAQTALDEDVDPSGSLPLILARDAALPIWTIDHMITVNADAALRDAIDAAPPYIMTLPRQRHSNWVRSAAYSPDGEHIVTASDDQTARIWDVTTWQEVRTLNGHAAAVYSAAYSPNGKFVVTASEDRTARIWDAVSGRELRRLGGHNGAVFSAAYSPDGEFIVTTGRDQTARIWDAATGQSVLALGDRTSDVTSAAYSPDGKSIITGGYQTARIWHATTGQEVREFNGHTGWVLSAAYSPDGKFVVTVGEDQTT